MNGTLGLNTLPSARMDPSGTTRISYTRTTAYSTVHAGAQISDRLYISLHQTAENGEDNRRLFPGLDLKLRLFKEKSMRPEISLGMMSAIGHKRTAAEYLALSKRYHNVDFTAGIGWGRMGTRQTIPNPALLKNFSGTHRDLDGENPNTPGDWFTGRAGIFGGVQYDIPAIKGLSLKGEWSSDGWKAEKSAYDDFDAPAPWSIGLSYRPYDWLDGGIAWAGGDSVMARISFSPSLADWSPRAAAAPLPVPVRERRDRLSALYRQDTIATTEDLGLSNIRRDELTAEADLTVRDDLPTPFQLGQGARHLGNLAGKNREQLKFHLGRYGLKGPVLSFNRRDIERADRTRQGSAEEIWRSTVISSIGDDTSPEKDKKDSFLKRFGVRIDWDTDFSLSERDSGVLYRTALIPSVRRHFRKHFISEQALRINLADSLTGLSDFKQPGLAPVRGDIKAFSRNRLLLEREYLAGFATIAPDLHIAGSIGYLEEMYGGATAEALYRPFDKPWAVGIEMTEAVKRDPETPLALGPQGSARFSTFLNGYYAFPESGLTLDTSIGRYLGGDAGGGVGLSNTFDSGATLRAFVTATNKEDVDLYGGRTNLYTGMSLSLPLGSLPLLPDGSRARVKAAPLGRDTAQRLDNPVPLYEITEPLSYRAVTRHWSELTPQP